MVSCQCQCSCHDTLEADRPELISHWYENRFWEFVGVLIIFFAIYTATFFLNSESRLILSVTAILVVIVGALSDFYSTMVNQRLIPEYDKRGLECPYYEANRLLPRRVTTRQMIFCWPTLVLLLVLPLVWVVPAVGFALAVGSFRATYLNQRWARFLKADLVFHDRQLGVDQPR